MDWREKWDIAMGWWKSQDDGTRILIRRLAVARIAEDLPEWNGIGSSDVNHEVFSMFKEYESAGKPAVIPWLADISQELS